MHHRLASFENKLAAGSNVSAYLQKEQVITLATVRLLLCPINNKIDEAAMVLSGELDFYLDSGKTMTGSRPEETPVR